MSTISVGLPSDGDTIDVADYNTPINTIVNEINGNLDNSNISSAAAISGSKIASGTITNTQIDFGGSGTGIWWEEIGRTVLGVAGDTISVASLPARKYLRVIAILLNSGALDGRIRFNNDSGNNYASKASTNYAAGADSTSASSITGWLSGSDSAYIIMDIINIANQNKSVIMQESGVGGAASSAPFSVELRGKWVNTSNQISRVDFLNNGAGDFAIGSEVIVLGHN